MSGLGGVGYGGFVASAIKQFQQNLFNQIDLNGDGSVTPTELEQAVTKAGGSTQAADALYAALDPSNTGGFGEQQLARALPGSGFSDQMHAQLIGYQAQGWPGAAGTRPGGQLAQSLFSQIDSNGDGAISQNELEQAVTSAGGSKEGADALYAKLDPNGSGAVSAQQFAQSLFQAMPHHRHHHHGGGTDGGATDGASAADALTSLFNADGGGPANSPMQIAQNMFAQADGNGDGVITQGELEQAVSAAGGSKAGADALFAKLDPGGTGSASQQQFIDALQPPSASGNTAQDALLALIDQVSQNNANPPAGAAGSATTGTPLGTGTSAQDALAALVQNFDRAESTDSGTSPARAFGISELARAFSLYQSQLGQKVLSSLGATQSASTI
jgi:Ca2+-binding EF-hand superfamily protein